VAPDLAVELDPELLHDRHEVIQPGHAVADLVMDEATTVLVAEALVELRVVDEEAVPDLVDQSRRRTTDASATLALRRQLQELERLDEEHVGLAGEPTDLPVVLLEEPFGHIERDRVAAVGWIRECSHWHLQ